MFWHDCNLISSLTGWAVNHDIGSLKCGHSCCSLVAESRLTLGDPVNSSPPGSSVHEISQGRIQGWVAISFSRGSSRPRDRTRASVLQADPLLSEPPGKPLAAAADHRAALLGGRRMLRLTWSFLVAVRTHCDRQFGNLTILISWGFREMCLGFSWLQALLLFFSPLTDKLPYQPSRRAVIECWLNRGSPVQPHRVGLSPQSHR